MRVLAARNVPVTTSTLHKQVPGMAKSTALQAIQRLQETAGLLVRMIPAGRGAAPTEAQTPTGPIVQVNEGRPRPNRTYQDLLRSRADEAAFDHYFTSQLTLVPVAANTAPRAIGAPGLVIGASISPNGRYVSGTGATLRMGPRIHYVKPTATGTGDATSWANASAVPRWMFRGIWSSRRISARRRWGPVAQSSSSPAAA